MSIWVFIHACAPAVRYYCWKVVARVGSDRSMAIRRGRGRGRGRCPQVLDRSRSAKRGWWMYVCWWGCVAYVVGGWCNNVTSSGSDASIRTRTCERSGWSPSYISYVRACSRTGKSAMTCRFEIDSLRRAPYVWFAKFYSCSGGNCFSTNARDIFEWWINKLTLAFNLIRLRLLPVDLECNN